ncbi:autotransporter outer membrane beta-barrel domain-containing protein [Sebaldella sp. S0638]|uniref:autotransporter outer membrane beta-barrel domain-containing protein n=1 Tax=Sebaldella sp. S0638 TaxID=2957809 RepID=UPI00209EC8D1|nr:autotransporter outer membrane beta-barrel domain-containing protein [Sebaldella sp. S0638]MCP1225819.1 hypothetical protein [Sebaldella sp. S0638]
MKRIILMSMLGTLSSFGNAQVTVNTSSDTINITSDTQTTNDLVITGEGPYTAGGNNGNPDPNWYLQGYKVSNGAVLENLNKIDLNAKYNNGVLISNNSSLINSGTINMNSTNGVGVLSADGTGTIINTSDGVINLTSGIGIATKGYSGPTFTGVIRNDGTILSTAGGTAIFTYGSQNIKGGTIENNGIIRVNGGTSASAVTIRGFSTFTNNNEVSGSASASSSFSGLLTGDSGAQLINSSTGVITGKNYANGVYIANSSLTNQSFVKNDGIITVEKGYGIYALASNVENNGSITSNNYGIYATKYSNAAPFSTVINNGSVTIGSNGIGIQLSQAIGENNGKIIIAGNNVTGVSIFGGGAYEGRFTNNSDIISGSDKTGITLIKLSGSTTAGDKTAHVYNNAALTALGDNSIAIYSTNNGKIHNTGDITVNNGIGIKLEYSSLNTGDNTGLITVKGSGIGILAGASYYKGSVLNNDGKIVLENNGTGIYVSSGTTYMDGTTGTNTGTIEFNGESGTGIYVTDAKTSFTNSADFVSTERNTTGMSVTKSASITNTGDMELSGAGSVGINITDSGNLISNTGTLSIDNGIGIRISNSELKDGQNTGIINIDGENGAGIAGINSKVSNNGQIYVSGMALGMYANNTELNNAGEINITEGTGIAGESNSKIVNSAAIKITDSGTGIKAAGSEVTNESTGIISAVKGTNIDVSSTTLTNNALLSNEDGVGILGNNSKVTNSGELQIIKGTGISTLNNSILTNSAKISITEGTGIQTSASNVTNTAGGEIKVSKGINIDLADSVLKNAALLINSNGVGINADNSEIENTGNISIENGTGILTANNSMLLNSAQISISTEGTGIKADNSTVKNTGDIDITKGTAIAALNNSSILNTGYLKSGNTGISSEQSTLLNQGKIEAAETGIYVSNNIKTVNTGEINGKTGVEIVSGAEEYSGHFLNTGKISGTDYAVKFDNSSSVLELGNGSEISGKINASGGENVLIVNGNVKIDSADNFNKIVSRGNSEITGIINLNPAADDSYYTEAFSGKKSMADLADETELGELTLSGVINVGVNYDGIVNETNKTGKIIAASLNLQNGKIVLNNAGNTVNDIAKESGLTNYGDQLRVKSIVVSNKKQAVDPSFQFQTTGGMNEAEGWTKETVSRIENGVTVLDALYTNLNKEVPVTPVPDPEPNPDPVPSPSPDPKPTAAEKTNAVPRNRVDLDSLNRLDTMSGNFLSMEADSMNSGERRQSVEYVGTKAGSNFKGSNSLNYDYDVDSDGIAGTTLYKHTDNLYSGFTLGYTDNKVRYDNGDEEKVNTFGIDVFGRYKTGNLNLDGHFGYGYNEHKLNADWLMAGRKESSYNSHVIKTGVTASYDQNLWNTGLVVTPSIGVDYIMVNEETIRTDGMAKIEGASGDGAVGKIGLHIGNGTGNFRWLVGIGYEQNFTDTFHKDRKMTNGYTMEELHYGKGTLNANLNMDFKITDKFTLKTGYEYENNSDFENHKINAGISYILGER